MVSKATSSLLVINWEFYTCLIWNETSQSSVEIQELC